MTGFGIGSCGRVAASRCVTCAIPLPFVWLARCEFHIHLVTYLDIVEAYYRESYGAEYRDFANIRFDRHTQDR